MAAETMSIRMFKGDYTRLLRIAARLEQQRSRRVSLAEVIESLIDEYPKPVKKGK